MNFGINIPEVFRKVAADLRAAIIVVLSEPRFAGFSDRPEVGRYQHQQRSKLRGIYSKGTQNRSRLKIAAALSLMSVACLEAAADAQLVPEGAVPEKVADGYKFTEGPALAPDGSIYFSDIPAALTLRFDPETGETTTVEENSGNANGLMFDHDGVLIACRHGAREVSRWSPERGAEPYRPAASRTYQGKKLNSPNDLDIDKAGNLYFTDPRYGNRDSMEMEAEGVYFQSKESDGASAMKPLLRLDVDFERPNGIVLSSDESILYVSDMSANRIYAYDVDSPGKVSNKREFARLNDGEGGGCDGMCVDYQGRLYAAGQSKVWVFEPTGQLVATIAVAKPTINVTFGADNETLYITANKGLYRIKLNTDAPLKHAKGK